MVKCHHCGKQVSFSDRKQIFIEENATYKYVCSECYKSFPESERPLEKSMGIDKKELFNALKKVSKKPLELDRKEVISEAILSTLNDIKNDLHLVTIILLLLFIFFIINLIFMFVLGSGI